MSSDILVHEDQSKTGLSEITMTAEGEVFADMIHQYCCKAGIDLPCMPAYGSQSLGIHPRDHEDTMWTAGEAYHDMNGVSTRGVLLVAHYKVYSGGKTQDRWWFPYETFRAMTVRLQGVYLGRTGEEE